MRDFIAADHYWRVGGDPAHVWSSRSGGYVPVSDPGYVAWLGRGMDVTTPIADEADLAAVLRGFGLPVPPAQVDLRAYAASARWLRETGGIAVAGARVATDRDSQAMIANAYQLLQASGAPSIDFKGPDGTFATLTADEFKAVALAVGTHVQACFSAEREVDAGIAAGTVTTPAEVDAAFAAVAA